MDDPYLAPPQPRRVVGYRTAVAPCPTLSADQLRRIERMGYGWSEEKIA